MNWYETNMMWSEYKELIWNYHRFNTLSSIKWHFDSIFRFKRHKNACLLRTSFHLNSIQYWNAVIWREYKATGRKWFQIASWKVCNAWKMLNEANGWRKPEKHNSHYNTVICRRLFFWTCLHAIFVHFSAHWVFYFSHI